MKVLPTSIPGQYAIVYFTSVGTDHIPSVAPSARPLSPPSATKSALSVRPCRRTRNLGRRFEVAGAKRLGGVSPRLMERPAVGKARRVQDQRDCLSRHFFRGFRGRRPFVFSGSRWLIVIPARRNVYVQQSAHNRLYLSPAPTLIPARAALYVI